MATSTGERRMAEAVVTARRASRCNCGVFARGDGEFPERQRPAGDAARPSLYCVDDRVRRHDPVRAPGFLDRTCDGREYLLRLVRPFIPASVCVPDASMRYLWVKWP
jgi:hypothetical protein